MSTILKFRPFAAQCRRYRPSSLSALIDDSPWWFHEPSSNSNSRYVEGGNRFGELVDNEQVWKLSYDLPGIKAKDLSVTFDGSNVQISAARHFAASNGDSKVAKTSSFFKSITVNPNTVDFSQFKANLSDGVLVISAPKKSQNDVTQIPITTEPHSDLDTTEEKEIEDGILLDEKKTESDDNTLKN